MDRRRVVNLMLLAVAVAGLAAGFGARWLHRADWAGPLMLAGTVPVLAALLIDSIGRLLRREVGIDVTALLSIGGDRA